MEKESTEAKSNPNPNPEATSSPTTPSAEKQRRRESPWDRNEGRGRVSTDSSKERSKPHGRFSEFISRLLVGEGSWFGRWVDPGPSSTSLKKDNAVLQTRLDNLQERMAEAVEHARIETRLETKLECTFCAQALTEERLDHAKTQGKLECTLALMEKEASNAARREKLLTQFLTSKEATIVDLRETARGSRPRDPRRIVT
ncbi:MAG: hypothetical protein M1837_002949 [Sclerophora amabilis]|nr:MAG: hypothetical protein M1837_002949 [Sclerophora amabilis]